MAESKAPDILACNMDAIMEIAKKHNLFVIEDACQVNGGSYNGKKLGTIGELGAFSLNIFKTITAGDGGAVVTNNSDLFRNNSPDQLFYFYDRLVYLVL